MKSTKEKKGVNSTREMETAYYLFLVCFQHDRVVEYATKRAIQSFIMKTMEITNGMMVCEDGSTVSIKEACELFKAQILADTANLEFGKKRVFVNRGFSEILMKRMAWWFLISLIKSEIISGDEVFTGWMIKEWKRYSKLKGGELQKLFWYIEEVATKK